MGVGWDETIKCEAKAQKVLLSSSSKTSGKTLTIYFGSDSSYWTWIMYSKKTKSLLTVLLKVLLTFKVSRVSFSTSSIFFWLPSPPPPSTSASVQKITRSMHTTTWHTPALVGSALLNLTETWFGCWSCSTKHWCLWTARQTVVLSSSTPLSRMWFQLDVTTTRMLRPSDTPGATDALRAQRSSVASIFRSRFCFSKRRQILFLALFFIFLWYSFLFVLLTAPLSFFCPFFSAFFCSKFFLCFSFSFSLLFL